MATSRPARDNGLLDAIDGLPASPFDGVIWRIVRDGRDPLLCSAVGGRWDDRTFDVLYTSMTADGAAAEMYFHLSRGQPVIPSLVRYGLFELRVSLSASLRFATVDDLAALGLPAASFGQLSYFERQAEYPRSQEIAEIAFFLGRDGLIVPSARSNAANVVVYCDRIAPAALEVVGDKGLISWEAWRRAPFGF